MTITPFQISIPDAALADLQARLGRVRWPTSLDGESWASGTSLAFMRRLFDRWQTGFDWPQAEAEMNRLPQFMARGPAPISTLSISGVSARRRYH